MSSREKLGREVEGYDGSFGIQGEIESFLWKI